MLFSFVSCPISNSLPSESEMAMAARGRGGKLPPEVNRILYIKNLPYKITGEEMYDIFGKFGAVRQIRIGNTAETRLVTLLWSSNVFEQSKVLFHVKRVSRRPMLDIARYTHC